MRSRLLLWVSCIAAAVAIAASRTYAAEPGTVLVGRIEGVINPISAQYVDRVVGEGEARGVQAVVFTIDTPGGLVDSTFKITGRFLNARVPVVTFVSPSGARAASAGTFITLAGHVAAMAPTTRIGAAHPVDSSGGDIKGDLRQKAENDTVAAITNIARARGRNAEWAEDAVRKSVSIGDEEAVRLKVVDLVAPDVRELLRRIDGREVTLPDRSVRLATREVSLDDDPPNPIEGLLHLIVDPQIAVLLFTIGTYGLIFELSNPSLIFPGVVGVIAIVLALFALGALDASAAGLALMVFGVILFALEVKLASHGLLTTGGIVSLVIGMLVLFPPFRPTLPGVRATVDPLTILVVVGVTAAFFLLVIRASIGYLRLPVASRNQLLGAVGVAKKDLAPAGIVYLAGQDWSAESASGTIPGGSRVRVLRTDGLRLIVEPDKGGGNERS